MTTYELAKEYAKRSLLKFAELEAYNWSMDYKDELIKSFVKELQGQKGYCAINPNNLTLEQALDLGFGKWDETDLMLIPLWIKPYLIEEFEGACINDSTIRTIKSSEIDNDHRFGCLADGVMIKATKEG